MQLHSSCGLLNKVVMAECRYLVAEQHLDLKLRLGIPYLLSGPAPTSAVPWTWTWAVLLGAKETKTNHIPPPHATGLPRWVRPAGGDLLVPRTIEKWVWLFYKTIGKEGSYLRWDYLTAGRRRAGLKILERQIIRWRDDMRNEWDAAMCVIYW